MSFMEMSSASCCGAEDDGGLVLFLDSFASHHAMTDVN